MWRNIASNALTLLVLIAVLAGGAVIWGKSQYEAAGPLESAICLRVERGSNMRAVSQDLEAQGAITSGTIFRAGADYTDRTRALKAGSFLITRGASMDEITAAITSSGRSTCGTEINFRIGVLRAEVQVRELDPETNSFVEKLAFNPADGLAEGYAQVRDQADVRFRVTLAEGVTSWQVVEELKAADFLNGEVSDIPPEGSLAPDSYEIPKGTARAALLARMQEAQSARLAELWAARSADLPLGSPAEALVLASIVEKETGVAEERPQVASVFVNRLNRGMRLQTDPTVIYGITKGQGALGRGLRQSELRKATPYNTYVIEGLPPTPIANPGYAAIEAALNPDTTPYIFFVADGTGGHAFAETLEQHNENVARWREIEAQRAKQ